MAMDEPPAQMSELDQIKFKMNAVTDEVSSGYFETETKIAIKINNHHAIIHSFIHRHYCHAFHRA